VKTAPLAGLLIAPALTLLGAAVAPGAVVSESVASALVFGGGAAAGLFALAASARAELAPRAAAGLAVAALGLLAVAALAPLPLWLAAALINLALCAVAHAVGGAIGRRVAHPGHLLPACAVAAAADVASLIHPSGPSHAIASSERALALFAVGFPVPGTRVVAPALGAGDLVFLALVLGVAAAHRLSLMRATLAGALGLGLAGALSARFEVPIPALVPIGAAVIACLPEARRLRAQDRRTAAISVAAAAALVAGVLLAPR
jgi:hypothetical protein